MRAAEWGELAMKRVVSVASMLAVLGVALAMGAMAQQAGDAGQESPQAQDSQAQDPTQISPVADPPSRVARLSFAQGNVSVEPASVNEFSPVEVNYPLTTADRVWADNGSEAELEAGQLAVRMGQATDLTVTAMTDTLAQFGLGQGSVHLRTYALDAGTTTELDTPNVAVTVLQPGDVRVDVDPNDAITTVTLLSGQVEVDGNGLQQVMQPGQSLRLTGTDPVAAQWVQPAGEDALDSFSQAQDQAYAGEESLEESYVNPDTVGAADLAQYGSWTPEADYGDVWFPTEVAVGWQPYCYGRWTWVAPWGWTWVESEPWGFAPFHYGRWAMFGGRWGWIPGPPVVHPVYAPALIVFVHPGEGTTAWFPLGPNEPYAPWYHASALYENRVNVSNIYSRNTNQVRSVYNTSNREVYANALGAQRQFVNRGDATVAMSQTNFAAGRPVRSSMLHLQPQQLAGAPVIPHPMVTPDRTMLAPAAARAVPPRPARPELTSREDAAIRAGSARTQPNQPMSGSPAAVGRSAPGGQPAPIERRGFQRGQPSQQSYRGNAASSAQSQQPQGQQQLYNRAVPPPARPSFEQQRQAIENTDPGRPLSPQQMDNLRQNRPAGQPQEREPAPHPVAQPQHSASQPQRSSQAPRSDSNRR